MIKLPFHALLVVLTLVGLAGCATPTNNVVNLSHYDAPSPDFRAIKAEGVGAVIHEATYSGGGTDAKYAGRQEAAARHGLLWGAYHFGDASDPVRQADRFMNFVQANRTRAARSGVVLVLDLERNSHGHGTMSAAQAATFIQRVHERTGVYPGLYSNEYWIRDHLNDPRVDPEVRSTLTRCWLWIANYHFEPVSTAPWSQWHLWQYTGDGVCDLQPRERYPTNLANLRRVERNMFRGDNDALQRFWTEHAWQP